MAPRSRPEFFLSFKNRILISTLLVLIGGVIVIGAVLQVMVFPRLEGDPSVIINLKIIHLVASLVVVAISWLFIEFISKKITLPLLELTKRADQISREAGKSQAPSLAKREGSEPREDEDDESAAPTGDEISQLKTSFYRMLAHLKASEALLRESEERHKFLFDNGPFPLFVLDEDGDRILDVNAGAEQEYQYTKEEFLGMRFQDLCAVDDCGNGALPMKDLVSSEIPLAPVLQHKRKDGSIFLTNLQARLSCWKDQPAVIAAAWDVTEKLEQEAMLIQTSKMATLGEMATGIAHELNQPLNVIKLGAGFLLKATEAGRAPRYHDLRQTAEEVGANVDRAALIIGHLRQFGRKAEATMSPVDLNVPIKGVFTLLGAQLKKAGIEWELTLDDDIPSILGDGNRLEQVFINLVLNARDALTQQELDGGLPEGGRKALKIRSLRDGKRVMVTVSDNGPGIEPGVKSRIFEPFFTTKKVGEGTGLGLSISYTIIKEHRGKIEVDGREGLGATFRLIFPALDQSAERNNDQNPDR